MRETMGDNMQNKKLFVGSLCLQHPDRGLWLRLAGAAARIAGKGREEHMVKAHKKGDSWSTLKQSRRLGVFFFRFFLTSPCYGA